MPKRVSVPSPRSPVMIAVTPRSLSQPNSRRSSPRRIVVFENAPKRTSIVSITTRVAPTLSIAAPSRRNSPSRSQSPVSSISRPTTLMWSSTSRPSVSNCGRSNPIEATLAIRSAADSSKATKTPGSSNWVIPRTRNSIASRVLPHPAGPQRSVGRPRGRPPPVTSSSPLIPVGAFGSAPSRAVISRVLSRREASSRFRAPLRTTSAAPTRRLSRLHPRPRAVVRPTGHGPAESRHIARECLFQ